MFFQKNKKRIKDKKADKFILWFKEIGIEDIPYVGGKNASLGEMYNHLTKKGVLIPNGFAISAKAYWYFIEKNNLKEKIRQELKNININDIKDLTKRGKRIRNAILKAEFPGDLKLMINEAYEQLAKDVGLKRIAVAVRSSATAEDLPTASFAGQQETYLNINGKENLLLAVKKCIASIFTDRAISYRETKGFGHLNIALSVAVQVMVKSDNAASGVMFTLDTESGFKGVVLINAAYGLGEYVVKGRVTPDQYYIFKQGLQKNKKAIISKILGTKEVKLVYGKNGGTKQMKVNKKDQQKFAVSDKDVLKLAKWGMIIEDYYKHPQDIEWAKDSRTGNLYIVQARPETVKSQENVNVIENYILKKKTKVLLKGVAVGRKIRVGKVRIIDNPSDMKKFKKGEILVTRITDPDWEPIMRIAGAIITEQGGKTSHAAIVSRELGVPCIVGAQQARKILKNRQLVTVSCAEGDEGYVYKGSLPFEVKRTEIKKVKKTKTKIMLNVGDPDNAFNLSFLPNDGVGLARLEFIFTNFVRIHPLALVHYNKLKDKQAKKQITELTIGYKNKTDYCVDKLAEGISRIAVSFYPKPVVVRLSDFKTNEYATLIGGKEFEPKEENPMLGWRGASRYYSKEYKPGFKLECLALKKAREEFGLDNIIVMVPFCRTPDEGKKVIQTMKEFGLEQGKNGLQIYAMTEIPANVVLAEEFAKIFDGFSIGSNDLTQLTLGVDRDSNLVRSIYDERNKAVLELIRQVIKVAHKYKRKIGICGQAPSDYPEFAEFLVKQGIDSISLNPDTVISLRQKIARVEKILGNQPHKTNKKYLGLLISFFVLAVSLLFLASGCTVRNFDFKTKSKKISIQNSELNLNGLNPQIIRQKLEQTKNKEKEKILKTKQVFVFDNIEFKYPVLWKLEQNESSIKFINENKIIKVYFTDQFKLENLQVSEFKTGNNLDFKLYFTDKNKDILAQLELDKNNYLEISAENFDLTKFKEFLNDIKFLPAQTDECPLETVIYKPADSEDANCQVFNNKCSVPEEWEPCY